MFCYILLNSLPNNKILDLSNFKAFADDNLRVAKMAKFVFDRVENIVGKGENAGNAKGEKAGNQHFLLFPRFQRSLPSGLLKIWIV